MALISKVQWLWPPNYQNNPSSDSGLKKVTLHLTAICSDTGVNTDESNILKLDISELRKVDGVAPTRTAIESIKWSIGGFNNVKLFWDRAPYSIIATMSGEGKAQDIVDESDGTDGTGDLLLTTYGAATGAVYDITVCVRLK